MRLDGTATAFGGVLTEAPPLERVREALLEDQLASVTGVLFCLPASTLASSGLSRVT